MQQANKPVQQSCVTGTILQVQKIQLLLATAHWAANGDGSPFPTRSTSGTGPLISTTVLGSAMKGPMSTMKLMSGCSSIMVAASTISRLPCSDRCTLVHSNGLHITQVIRIYQVGATANEHMHIDFLPNVSRRASLSSVKYSFPEKDRTICKRMRVCLERNEPNHMTIGLICGWICRVYRRHLDLSTELLERWITCPNVCVH